MLPVILPSLRMLLLMTALCGVLYPLLVTGLAQGLFPHQAEGSLLRDNGVTVGSSLVGQPFSEARYFRGRPSATSPAPYNAAASSGSNLGPVNPALEEVVKARIAALRESDPDQTRPIPVDLVTASGSGLDPHISPAAAQWQIPRVAKARDLSEKNVQDLVAQHTQGRTFGLLGEARVNVLTLNRTLDRLKK
ncbi:MAG: potassium-transporting ATPase subunit KdpC [Magnetococcales bacterium]|nr:potassium-transporting ATPase subunit KdpC [Magnetococcales bacterium]